MCDLIIILCTWLMILILNFEIRKVKNEVIVLRKAVILLLSIEQDKIRRMPGGK
nr:MAG TPA: hypothetical protein [Caudoviricetes sp.]